MSQQGSNTTFRVGGTARQAGGNWTGRFENPEGLNAWHSMYGSRLEPGDTVTVGDAILKWNGSAYKVIDGDFVDGPAANAWAAKFSPALASGSTATIAGVPSVYRGPGVGWVVQSITRTMAELYAVERSDSSTNGYRNEPRPQYPTVDIPTLTASASDPAGDTDAAAQSIQFFGTLSGDPLTKSQIATGSKWFSGFNPNLRAFFFGPSVRLATTLQAVGTNGSQDQDALIEPGTSWGISGGIVALDFWLDSDVAFLRMLGGNVSRFELFVNGRLCTGATVGTGMETFNPARLYYPSADGYVKIKFTSAARRRITLMLPSLCVPSTINTRNISTILPVKKQGVWIHSGDSFSQNTISDSSASSTTQGLTQWLHSMYGFEFNFINIAIGGTSLSNTSQVLPSSVAPYTNGLKPSQRKCFNLTTVGLNADVITCLFGHNDANNYAQPLFESELRAFISDARAMHPKATIVIFGTAASPGIISTGNDVRIETVMSTVCASLGVTYVPLQSTSPKLMRGTGNQGSPSGVGNTDLYIGPDNTHPTIKGHRDAYGLTLASLLYDAIR